MHIEFETQHIVDRLLKHFTDRYDALVNDLPEAEVKDYTDRKFLETLIKLNTGAMMFSVAETIEENNRKLLELLPVHQGRDVV